LLAHAQHRIGAVLQIRIVGINAQREVGVGVGVFVGTVYLGRWGQSAQLLQAIPHLLRRAAQQSATAQRKQRIADKHRFRAFKVICDVVGGMAGNL